MLTLILCFLFGEEHMWHRQSPVDSSSHFESKSFTFVFGDVLVYADMCMFEQNFKKDCNDAAWNVLRQSVFLFI